MHFTNVFVSIALVGTVLAVDHSVKVGGNNKELTFTPNNINATKGDTVTFHFWPSNHSVAQSTFAKPCEPMSGGFWSGYIASSSGGAMETFMYTVEDETKPVWFYCTQGQHCISGMAGAINAPATGNTVDKFISSAKAASSVVIPSSVAGTGGMLMNGTMTASSSASGSTASSTGAASTLELNKNVAFTGLLGMFAYLMM
ncbi:Cupredoxin [Lindgomyces ingoldianus]|uniref:Cupredoxin n=1 Tax=Lindgomyces ingoldianus TaxID=673940 RepID=A0ACB6RGN4_9PLEO|nr:Cupredoxin [Lindgomyces ingoldianus]KAF2477487.1 Cupredoxin [Lindgomyces ingoldianus]